MIRLTEDHKALVEDKPEVKKAGGIYYTPSYIVDYIVHNTVVKLTEGKTPKEISEIRVLDPACGSGSFLIGAYQHLLDWHRDWYAQNLVPLLESGEIETSLKIKKLLPSEYITESQKAGTRRKKKRSFQSLPIYQAGKGYWPLTADEKKRILLNNIYGVDLDPQAVEVTKLSLLLKVLEGENTETIQTLLKFTGERALPDLGNNIKCGNTLVEWDILNDYPNLPDEVRPFDWNVEFPDIMQAGGFDVVIGNPPYVRQESLGRIKEYFKQHYKVYNGTADLYTYFIERGISLLRNGGLFSYIVASKWMKSNYGRPLRKWLKGQCIDEIIDFEALPVFQTATTYTCIIRVSKEAPKECFLATQVKALYFQDLGNYLAKNRYYVTQFNLRDDGWSLADRQTQELLDKLRNKGTPLEKYLGRKPYYGTKTGLNEAFVIDFEIKEKIVAENPQNENIIKPFLAGKDIKRYHQPTSDKYVIAIPKGWTREMSGSTWDAWGWIKKSYPAIANHLEPFMDKAKKRCDQGDYWWELRACDYYAEFEKPKILWPGISAEVSAFAFDSAGYYGNDNNQLIVTEDMYLLGILNSRLIRFILTNLSDKVQGGFYRLKIIYIEQLPIYAPNPPEPQDTARYDRIVALVERMLDLNRHLDDVQISHEKIMLQRQIDATDKQIDRIVYELYGLTEEEIRIVEDA